MSDDFYKAPESSLIEESANEDASRFYVVSTTKFMVLFFITLGVYTLYWFYKHWYCVKWREGSDIWPVPRAIFNIFFTHSLFARIKEQSDEKGGLGAWPAGLLATVYVAGSIIAQIVENFAQDSLLALASVFFLPLGGYILWSAQIRANLACGDPTGESNASFTGLNYLFIVLGLGLWGLVGVGVYIGS